MNSVGTGAELLASGNPSLALDTLRFQLEGGTPATFGVLTSGANRLPNAPANPCFGLDSGLSTSVLDGLRCVGGDLVRHGARPTDASGAIGVTTNGWGPPNGPPGGLLSFAGFGLGQARNFQVFYRENDALVCQTGQNTSNGVGLIVLP